MEEKGVPNPRFSEFSQVQNQEGKLIGFSIPNCEFIFKYDNYGGWFDEQGRYYNPDGIQQLDEEEDADDLEDDEQGSSENDDQLVDQFQDMLRQQEQGYVKPAPKKVEEEVKSPPPLPVKEKQHQVKDFQELLAKYACKKQHLKQNLPEELFIYFKQRAKFFEPIKNEIQKLQSVEDKNKHIDKILKGLEEKKDSLKKADKWLSQPGVFLDFSGESQVSGEYQRYWYGHIKTTADRYIQLLKQVDQSEVFYLLENKTYYALKSKFYHKKSEEKIKTTIKEFASQIQSLAENQYIVIRLDNLRRYFPLSSVYDLVQYVNGKPEDIQVASVIDEYSAQLTVSKSTALKIINLQAYNHDKGEYVQVSLKKTDYQAPNKKFYSISIDGPYKVHECELKDTLALKAEGTQLSRHCTQDVQKQQKIRFVLGSIAALKKVLMFRGQSLNVVLVQNKLPK